MPEGVQVFIAQEVKRGEKISKEVKRDQKRLKEVKSGQKRSKEVKGGQRKSKEVKKGQKRSKVVKTILLVRNLRNCDFKNYIDAQLNNSKSVSTSEKVPSTGYS